jgi:hypothetical protein
MADDASAAPAPNDGGQAAERFGGDATVGDVVVGDSGEGRAAAPASGSDGPVKKMTRAERMADPFYVQRRKIHELVVKDDLEGALAAYQALKTIESRIATRPDVEVINLLLHRAAKECKLVSVLFLDDASGPL